MQRITHIWTHRFVVFMLAGLGTGCHALWAQKTSSAGIPATTPNTGTANSGVGTRGTIGNNPNNQNYPSSTDSSISRPIFLSGKVMFDDGSQPNMDVRIERICSGSAHVEGHTDSKGRFSFQLGQSSSFNVDASESNSSFGGPNQPGSGRSNGGMLGNSSLSASTLWNCELRASYPGYRSDSVQLATRRSLDDPDIGVIILHRLANVQGTTISLTTAMAPKAAVKQLEKGQQLAQKNKLEEAEQHLQQATELYPKFAAAWFALGQVQQRQNKPDEARKAYLAAIAADTKYVSPYERLSLLAAQDGKWEDAAAYSKQAISLNPVEFPTAFWFNALANYNLKKPDEALKSAQALVKIDTQHRIPEAENLLAQLAMDSRNYTDAAVHLRAYLALAPNAKNADLLKRQLSQIDEASAAIEKK